jgi:hypothetical protein
MLRASSDLYAQGEQRDTAHTYDQDHQCYGVVVQPNVLSGRALQENFHRELADVRNIALVLKYFDQLVPIMQEQDSKLRPAD